MRKKSPPVPDDHEGVPNPSAMRDPSLLYYAFFDKHALGQPRSDHHDQFLRLLTKLVESFQLDCSGSRYATPDDINMVAIERSDVDLDVFISCSSQDAQRPAQAFAYTFGDTLVLQFGVYHNAADAGTDAWQELWNEFHAAVAPDFDAPKHPRFWGDTIVLWGLTPVGTVPTVPSAERLDLPLTQGRSRQARLKLGHLVSYEPHAGRRAHFALISEAEQGEERANALLYEAGRPEPAPFVSTEMFVHKLSCEAREYHQIHAQAELLAKRLDRGVDWILERQREKEPRFHDVSVEDTDELSARLALEAADVADFSRLISQVRELRNTVAVNRRNLEVHSETFATLLGPPVPDAARPTTAGATDLFAHEILATETLLKQIDSDLAYHDAVARRAELATDSLQVRLDVLARQQQRHEMLIDSFQSSLITALLAGVAALEVLVQTPLMKNLSLISALAFALFSVVLWLSQLPTRILGEESVLAHLGKAGAAASLVASLFLYAKAPPPLAPHDRVVLALLCLAIGIVTWTCSRLLDIRRVLAEERARRRLQITPTGISDLDELIREELPELLKDLPGSPKARVKQPDSIRGKLNKWRAQGRVNGGPREITELGDEIGIRYVVAPWEIDRVVSSVIRRVNATKVNYLDRPDGYKSVHIDADLLGRADDRDIDLTAEIQVRTPLMDRFANFSHSRIYKPAEGRRPGWTVRACARVLKWAGDIEMLLFRGWMRWGRLERAPAPPQSEPPEERQP